MKFEPEYLTGEVIGVFSTANKENFVTRTQGEIRFELTGIEGDRHSGHTRNSGGREKKYYAPGTLTRNNRQWSAVSTDELNSIQKEMGVEKVLAEWLGANLLISGIKNFSKIPPLSHFMFEENGPCLVVFEENGPCKYPDDEIKKRSEQTAISSFPKAAKGLRGLVGWVDRPGPIKAGDKFRILLPLGTSISDYKF